MAQKLSESELESIREKFPGLPEDYLSYLSSEGWGEVESGRMIYSGPVLPQDIFSRLEGIDHIVILGDDFQGYCIGYDLDLRSYGELSVLDGWCPFAPEATFQSLVS